MVEEVSLLSVFFFCFFISLFCEALINELRGFGCPVALTLMWQRYVDVYNAARYRIYTSYHLPVCMFFAIDKRLISLEHAEDSNTILPQIWHRACRPYVHHITMWQHTIANGVNATRKWVYTSVYNILRSVQSDLCSNGDLRSI